MGRLFSWRNLSGGYAGQLCLGAADGSAQEMGLQCRDVGSRLFSPICSGKRARPSRPPFWKSRCCSMFARGWSPLPRRWLLFSIRVVGGLGGRLGFWDRKVVKNFCGCAAHSQGWGIVSVFRASLGQVSLVWVWGEKPLARWRDSCHVRTKFNLDVRVCL